jgi:PAS domain S-box-containing protein
MDDTRIPMHLSTDEHPPFTNGRPAALPSLSGDDLQRVIDGIAERAIFLLDAGGRIVTWGREAEAMHGYSAAEILGEHCSKFYRQEDLAADMPSRELAAAAECGRIEEDGWRIRRDGSRFWANVVTTALHDEQGRIRGFARVLRDLTPTRAVEQELRAAEQRFHQLVDAISDYAIIMLDATGHVVTWNPGAARITGYTADAIIGTHFSVFYTPEARAAGRPDLTLQTAESAGHYEEEGWRLRKDGSRFWANVVLAPLRGGNGKLIGFAKVARDLTERRMREEQLRQSEERLRLLIENVVDYAIYVLDPTGRVTTWNMGAERMTGYTPKEIPGKNFKIFFPEEDVRAGKPQAELDTAQFQVVTKTRFGAFAKTEGGSGRTSS